MTTSPRRIVIVAPVHAWDDVRVFQKEAVSLAAAGYDVTLIAQAPNSFQVRGVRIMSAPKARSRLGRFLKLPAVFFQALRLQADVYHLHNPDTLAVAIPLKLAGKRVIYDTHEDFSRRLLMRDWIPMPLRPLLAAVIGGAEAVVGRLMNASIVTQPLVQKRMGKRSILIGNAPLTKGPLIENARKVAMSIEGGQELRLIYVGGISRARGLEPMVEALSLLNDRQIPTRLWLIGRGDEAMIAAAMASPGGSFVDFLGQLPQELAFAYMLKSDVGLVTILDVGDHAHTSPNKLYEYLICGLPVVASDFPAWKSSLPQGAVFVKPGSAIAIAAAVEELAGRPDLGRNLGAAGRAHVETSFSWEGEVTKLTHVYACVLAERRQS